MSLLYSRPNIRLPKIRIAYPNHNKKIYNKNKKWIFLPFILLIISIIMLKSVIPIFNNMCLEKAKSIATLITNQETKNVVKNYEYSDLMIIHKDATGNILMLEANMKNINEIITNIAKQIQTTIDTMQQEEIEINLGSFTGIHFLVGRGVKIPIRLITAGNVKTTVKSDFLNKGINQTLHRLYLEVECEISILTPFNTLQESITNQVILVENVMMGDIPNSYYHIEGINENQALELIQ